MSEEPWHWENDKPKRTELFVPADQIRTGLGHPFYDQLNQVLEEGGFDPFLEELCAPHYNSVMVV
ncbi:MAG: hypothetical protein CMO80_03925, partial [Verrucomicrobiales bacterium]|nr:hypothetical protein [Verrucomicrobiales bacterium]